MNIQATGDLVMFLRGDLLGQPYLTLVARPDGLKRPSQRLRILTYNIKRGGVGREEAIAAVINAAAPDIVVLQEASRPDVVAPSGRCDGDDGDRRAPRPVAGVPQPRADRVAPLACARDCRSTRFSKSTHSECGISALSACI